MKTRLLLLVASACAVALAQTASSGQEQQAVHHNFKFMTTGKAGPTKGATAASVQAYESEDGTWVVQLREWYKSASDARRGLDTLTKKASRVIEQGSEKNGKGRMVGKRVELVFRHGDKTSPEMVIAWTDGATVVRLRSTSLPLLLDFESQYYPGNSEARPDSVQ
jgi:hypothetical protein